MKKLIDKLHQEQILSAEEFRTLLTDRSEETDLYARELADQVRQQVCGHSHKRDHAQYQHQHHRY